MRFPTRTAFTAKAILLLFVSSFALSREAAAQNIITNPSRGQVIISEFRSRGPNGENDEFVEIYNATTSTIRVVDQSADARYRGLCELGPLLGGLQCGWALSDLSSYSGGSAKFIIPENVEIPAHGHYLIANNGPSGYSLGSYATPDGTYTADGGTVTDIPDGSGIALFKTADTSAFSGSNVCLDSAGATNAGCVLDGVGFGNNAEPYREGTGLTPVALTDSEHSYVRKITTSGFPQDTDNNSNDFMLISTEATTYSACSDAPSCTQYNNLLTSYLGAPGPEGLSSPVNRTSQLRSSLIDSGGSLSGANAERQTGEFIYNRPNGGTITFPAGTLTLRRRITNTTGANVTRLRIRISTLTTLNSPGYAAGGTQSDARAINSNTTQVTLTSDGTTVTAQGVTLEESPDQPQGGGYNATLNIPLDSSTYPNGLPNNASVTVNIRFGIKQGGSFRFSYTVEALP